MVRRLLAITLALMAVLPAMAEVHYRPQVRVGGKAGATLSSMSFSPSVKQTMLPGVICGATFAYAEERVFGLRAELNVEQRGWKENFEEANSAYSYSRTLTYVQLPLLTQISFGSRRVQFMITLGPEVAYMIGESTSSNFDPKAIASLPGFPLANRTNEQLTMSVSNKFDYGISAGVGAEFRLNRRHAVSLDGRFYYGLGNVFPDHKKDVFNASRGMSFQFTLGYNIRLK